MNDSREWLVVKLLKILKEHIACRNAVHMCTCLAFHDNFAAKRNGEPTDILEQEETRLDQLHHVQVLPEQLIAWVVSLTPTSCREPLARGTTGDKINAHAKVSQLSFMQPKQLRNVVALHG